MMQILHQEQRGMMKIGWYYFGIILENFAIILEKIIIKP